MSNKNWQELYKEEPEFQKEFGNWQALKSFTTMHDFKACETQKIIDFHKKIKEKQLSRYELIEKHLLQLEERIKKLEAGFHGQRNKKTA